MALEIAIEELGNGNEKVAYVSLPANKKEVIDALDREKIFGKTFLRINECDEVPELVGYEFTEEPTLEELNFLAKRIEEISEEKSEIIAYRAFLQKPYDTIREAINRTYNLETIPVYPCKSLYSYGEIVLENEFLEELRDIPDEIYDLLDPDKVGRAMMEREGGVFIGEYYAIPDSYEPSDLAAAHKISEDNFRWYAAFHNKETNPHVHIVVYAADGKQGFLTEKGIEKIRSAFANDIYKDELQNLYQQQTVVRDKLRSEAESVMENMLSELQNNNQFDPNLEQLVFKLRFQLQNSKGKKVYGYLQPNVKKTVDQIVAELAKNPVLKKMYDEWCALEQQKYETYTSAVQKSPPLEENKVFKPIKNAVIQAVLEMDNPVQELNSEMFSDNFENDFGEAQSSSGLYIKWTEEYKSACDELYKNKNIQNAFLLMQSEAEKGNVLALHDIGKMYRNGLLGEDNIPKADEYFQKALQGFLEIEPTAKRLKSYVQYRIGKMFALGYGTEQDYTKAFKPR